MKTIEQLKKEVNEALCSIDFVGQTQQCDRLNRAINAMFVRMHDLDADLREQPETENARPNWTRGYAAGICAAWRAQHDDSRVRNAIEADNLTLEMFEDPKAEVPEFDLKVLREILRKPQLAMLERLAQGPVGSSGGVHEARVLNNLKETGLARSDAYRTWITETGFRALGCTLCVCGCGLESHLDLGRCKNCDSNYGARIDCYKFELKTSPE